MQISKITIDNFRSIEHAELSPSAFNVLVGQNNHGKTNFFEAIEWFYNGSGDLGQIAFMHDSQRDVSVELEYTNIQAGIETVKNEKTKESFRKFADGRDTIRVVRRKSDGAKRSLWDEEKNEWSPKNFAGFDKAFNDCLPRLQYVSTSTRLAEVSKYGKKTPIGEMLSGVLTAIMETSPTYRQFREKFEEMFGGEGSEVRAELNSLANSVKEHLEQQFPECSQVTFSVAEPAFDDLLKNFETSINDGIETKAEEKGDGMQRALMLAIIKTYSDYRREKDELGKRFLFLIDEAELHLHPTAQRQLKEALLLLAGNGDQVFINTHSSVLVADNHASQQLLKVQKLSSATHITPITDVDKPHVVYELLGGSPADLLFPNNFMIVEGRSEYELLIRLIKRFYQDKPNLQIIFAEGDIERQRKSMDAINTAFTPLNQTAIYRNHLIILCDKPNAQQAAEYEKFVAAYPQLSANNQLFQLGENSLEECYPATWRKTAEEVAQMKFRQKTDLAAQVGENITKADFETGMPTIFNALSAAWEKAHQ
ncbi:ATP-dependent nuclease [Ferrigenium sp. UT5]|uniref:ATP-dependent nuclease n=1 Tax=Ferrigenium sp. UT5 TaxID=3242105 RepID=UPI00354F10BC